MEISIKNISPEKGTNALLKVLNDKKNAKEYQKKRLAYCTGRTIAKLEKIKVALVLAEKKVNDLATAIGAIEEGELKAQLTIMKVKADYKLFLLKIRRDKVNVAKIIISQSKLNELEAILMNLKADIESIEARQTEINNPLFIVINEDLGEEAVIDFENLFFTGDDLTIQNDLKVAS